MSFYWLFALCAFSYIFGNINFSVIISKLRLKKDIRKQGSGNPGAMNMLRNFGFKWAFLVFLLDAAKGALPAFIGAILYGFGTPEGYIALYACGFAAAIGHCFPVISKFKGGKGVATTAGVWFAADPLFALAIFGVAIAFVAVFGSGSTASFIYATVFTIWEFVTGHHGITVYALILALYALILFKHRGNIKRLLNGTEGRVSLVKKKS